MYFAYRNWARPHSKLVVWAMLTLFEWEWICFAYFFVCALMLMRILYCFFMQKSAHTIFIWLHLIFIPHISFDISRTVSILFRFKSSVDNSISIMNCCCWAFVCKCLMLTNGLSKYQNIKLMNHLSHGLFSD